MTVMVNLEVTGKLD